MIFLPSRTRNRLSATGLRKGFVTRERHLSTNNAFFKVSEEVRDALQSKKPVVALETTIYTHGD